MPTTERRWQQRRTSSAAIYWLQPGDLVEFANDRFAEKTNESCL
jgi:hypothetical protein